MITRSDHSLQHLYGLLDCQVFRKDERTTTLLGMTTEASATSVGCNNHHSLFITQYTAVLPINLRFRSNVYIKNVLFHERVEGAYQD